MVQLSQELIEEVRRELDEKGELPEHLVSRLCLAKGDMCQLLEVHPDALVRVDAAGRILSANSTAIALFNSDEDTIIGKNPMDLGWSETSVDGWNYLVASAVESGVCQRGHIEIKHPPGERLLDWQLIPMESGNGTPKVVIGIGRDITDLHIETSERVAIAERMQRAMKVESLELVTRGIAHEFNNLLMGVMGYADLIYRSLEKDSKIRNQIEKIIRSAQRSTDLCEQLLIYSGRGTYSSNSVNLLEVIEEMFDLIKETTKGHIEFVLPDSLPQISADREQIEKAVLNLVTNASEALSEDEHTIELSLGTVELGPQLLENVVSSDVIEPGTYVYLRVIDTGKGIEPDVFPKIFDPFFSTKPKHRGLGLSIVYGITRIQRGAITVESKPHQGSTFSVYFPVSDAVPAATPISRTPIPWRASGSVLVVDDEPNALRIAQLFLEEVGFDVLLAEDGRQGLDVFRENAERIVAVVLDLTMPRMGGEETFRQIRAIRHDVPVILSSGYPEEEVTQRFAGQQWAGFIQKPYRFTALIHKLKEIL